MSTPEQPARTKSRAPSSPPRRPSQQPQQTAAPFDPTRDFLVIAQRQAVHEYRLRLINAAQRRFGTSGCSSTEQLLQWLATVSTESCCAPAGVVLHPGHLDTKSVDEAVVAATPELPRKRLVCAPPPLPTASWNLAPPRRSLIDTGTMTDKPASPAPLVSTHTPISPRRNIQAPAHAASAPSTPTGDNLEAMESLRTRVVALSTENAELERRCERMKTELHSLRKASSAPHTISPAPALVLETPPMRSASPPQNRTPKGVGSSKPKMQPSGNAKARTLHLLREIKSKLAVIKTGVRALGASDLFHNATALLVPFLQQHATMARRMAERAEFFEKTAQSMQAKLLSLPDAESPDGYEVQINPDGRSSALQLDAKTWVDFTQAFTGTVDAKFVKVEDFANRGARSLLRSSNSEKELQRLRNEYEQRSGELESIAVDWECLAVSIASESVFESVTVQPAKKLEFTSLQKFLSESNDEVRVVCGVAGWYARPGTRSKATAWREKRADTINKVEQLLSQELQHFMMNGPQRNSLRRKVLLLRELAGLLLRLRTDTEPPSQQGGASTPTTVPVPPASSTPNSTNVTPARPSNRAGRELQVAAVRATAELANATAVQNRLNLTNRGAVSQRPTQVGLIGSDASSGGVVLPAVGSPAPKPARPV